MSNCKASNYKFLWSIRLCFFFTHIQGMIHNSGTHSSFIDEYGLERKQSYPYQSLIHSMCPIMYIFLFVACPCGSFGGLQIVRSTNKLWGYSTAWLVHCGRMEKCNITYVPYADGLAPISFKTIVSVRLL